jgi:hypothetical protein
MADKLRYDGLALSSIFSSLSTTAIARFVSMSGPPSPSAITCRYECEPSPVLATRDGRVGSDN